MPRKFQQSGLLIQLILQKIWKEVAQENTSISFPEGPKELER